MEYKKDIEALVDVVIKENGSDIHLAEGRNPTIRVAGSLIPLTKFKPQTKADLEGIIDFLVSPASKKIFEEKRQIDFAYQPSNTKSRFRGNAY